MRHHRRPFQTLLVLSFLTATVTASRAHCCDGNHGGVLLEEIQFRPGVHGLDNGITDGSIQADPPFIGRGLGQRGQGNMQGSGLGEMRGNSLGAYGAGSIGEMGPGGLGALRGEGIGGRPPRPR